MKNINTTIIAVTVMLGLTGTAQAQGSARHFSKAVGNSVDAVAHTSIGTGKLVSGAVAVPLMISGEVGKVSSELGSELWDEANEGLPITEDIITAGPIPADAMNNREKQ